MTAPFTDDFSDDFGKPLDNEPADAWQGRQGAGQRTVGHRRSTPWQLDADGCRWRLHGDLPQ